MSNRGREEFHDPRVEYTVCDEDNPFSVSMGYSVCDEDNPFSVSIVTKALCSPTHQIAKSGELVFVDSSSNMEE